MPVRILVIAVIALAATLVSIAPAGAAAGEPAGSAFCSTGQRFSERFADADLSDPDEIERVMPAIVRLFRRLQAQAPEELRAAFRKLRPGYEDLAENPTAETAVALATEPKYRKAFTKLSRYVSRECKGGR